MFLGLGLKIGISGLVIWASKSPRWFLNFGLKTKQVSVCRLRHKINGERTRHASRFGGLFHLEANHAMISQSDIKTGGCVMTDGTHDIIVEVASGSS
jgi:hypothetical protein